MNKAQYAVFHFTGLILILFFCLQLNAQRISKTKDYPSVFWEITGNGLKKPSYLFGTMHVSSKLAFHLSDSFYRAIKSVDVVALETNPETWQDDFTNSKYSGFNRYGLRNLSGIFSDYYHNEYWHKTSLEFNLAEKELTYALSSKPEILNSFLYRNYQGEEDFEENTFLDMYLYQTGKKLQKKIAGVENFEETEKLLMQAFKKASKETYKYQNYNEFDYKDGLTLFERLQNAYRKGDLDELDTLNKLTSRSKAYDEIFIYKRNEIQANSADSIMQSGRSLFVGVGAAHVPGQRGVIDLLRKKGYKVRPIFMGTRDGLQKDLIDEIRVPQNFSRQYSADSIYSVELPGKLYKFNNRFNQVQYADMSNGVYYLITRVKTNSLFYGLSAEDIFKKVDSLLYENIPGKIEKKIIINRNGYKGFDITNKTRKGDRQRYNIFITPFEVMIFKISGLSDYVIQGTEADKFLNSIKIKEVYKDNSTLKQYKGPGFKVHLPHEPFTYHYKVSDPERWQFEAYDVKDSIQYTFIKTALHNYSYLEEDTFELGLLHESFSSNKFIQRILQKQHFKFGNLPTMDVEYKFTDSSNAKLRFIMRGNQFYILMAHGKKLSKNTEEYLNSISLESFQYKKATQVSDSTYAFNVVTPVYPSEAADMTKLMNEILTDKEDLIEMKEAFDVFGRNAFYYPRMKIINDTTGEEINVQFAKTSKYYYASDTADFWRYTVGSLLQDSDYVYKNYRSETLPDGMLVQQAMATDTNSSRAILFKIFYKNGVYHALTALTDTSNSYSYFYNTFFNTFKPFDSLKAESPLERKSEIYFKDFFSTDTLVRKKARSYLYKIDFDEKDFNLIKNAIAKLSWNDKDYISLKSEMIAQLGWLEGDSITDYLDKLYKEVGDTLVWQKSVLTALLKHKTKYAYSIFKKNLLNEPPVLNDENSFGRSSMNYDFLRSNKRSRRSLVDYTSNYNYSSKYSYSNGDFFSSLEDSLLLTKTLFPEIMDLASLDDYKQPVMNLLKIMVDSGFMKASEYETFYSKFYLEARQKLRKQLIGEKQKQIELKEKEMEDDKEENVNYYSSNISEEGNSDLDYYSVLLMPFWDKQTNVQKYFNQLFTLNDKRVKYNTSILLLRNKRAVPDSMWMYFAKDSTYLYELYSDLKIMNKINLIPSVYLTQTNLAKAYTWSDMDKIDTLCFLDTISVTFKNTKGLAYFYKYKEDKKSNKWMIKLSCFMDGLDVKFEDVFDSEEKLDEDKPIREQLNKILKENIMSTRRSAIEFYKTNNNYYNQMRYDD